MANISSSVMDFLLNLSGTSVVAKEDPLELREELFAGEGLASGDWATPANINQNEASKVSFYDIPKKGWCGT